MKTYLQIIAMASIFLAIILLACGGIVCAGEGKIPISTSSEKAKDLFLKGRQLSESMQVQESITYYQQAVDEDPNFAIAHLNLAFVQPTAKGFFASFDKARALVDNVSEGERLWILGFEALALNGDAAGQKEMWSKLTTLYPNDERAHNLLGNHFFGQQKYKQAIEEYEKAIAINPQFSQPFNQLGYAYRFRLEFKNAEKTFQRYIDLIPNDPNPYDSYAELLLKMGRYDESIKNYHKALKVNPNFINSHIGIATNFLYKNEHDLARNQLQQFFDHAKNDGQRRTALTFMAVSFVDQGNYKEAHTLLDKQFKFAEAIADTSAMAGDYAQRANILLAAGKVDKALHYFDKSVELIQASSLSKDVKKQNKLNYLYNAARVHIAKGELEPARKMAHQYAQKAKSAQNQFQIYQAIELNGLIALAEERFADAAESFENGNPLDPYIIYKTAVAYSGAGNTKMANEYFEKAGNFNGLMNMRMAYIRSYANRKMAAM